MSTQPPVLSPEPGHSPRRRHGGLLLLLLVPVLVLVVAAAGFAAWQLLGGGGRRPAEVLPASTFAMVSVDLAPSGGQKLEAIRTLRKLPSFRDRVGLNTDDDLAQKIFEKSVGHGPCAKLDYDKDVKPWIGHRAALGGVMLDKKPRPVLALQVVDHDAARTGFARLVRCAEPGDDFAWTLTDDYVVASDSAAHAKQIVAAGEKSSLADDDDYEKWTDEAGGDGVMQAYVARSAVDVLAKELDGFGSGAFPMAPAADSGGDDHALKDALKDFHGAAAVLRFADSGIELSFAGSKTAGATSGVGDQVTRLPADTAAVLGLRAPRAWLEGMAKGMSDATGDDVESMTGLRLPEDLITLLGQGFSLSVGGKAPADLDAVSGPADLPLGMLVHGDQAAIREVISRVERATGASLADIPAVLESRDGKVAVASTREYADQLLTGGSLGDDEGFRGVVPHADEAQAVAYVDLDGAWTDRITAYLRKQDDKDAREIADDLAALEALGASSWTDGDVAHGLVRLALK